MRTKEVEEAIKILDKYKIRLLQTRKEIGLVEDFKNHHTEKQYNRCTKRANAIDKVIEYIEELEEETKEIEFDLTSVYMSGFYDGEKKYKDKIRDKIKELNEELIAEERRSNFDDCRIIRGQIKLLESLLEGE